MILQAEYDRWLTQAADVPAKERVFLSHTAAATAEEAAGWTEITSRQKEVMMMTDALLGAEDMDYGTISRAEEIIRRVGEGIRERINGAGLTDGEALEKKDWFPSWERVMGVEVTPGFRLTHGGALYAVTRRHTVKEESEPGRETAGLYSPVRKEDTP